jgi:hypothetical protein
LDVLEGYPRLYRRETVAATLADGSVVKAMVYVMQKLPEGVKAVGSGDWRKRRKKYHNYLNKLDSTEFLPIVHWGHVTV